MPGKTTSSAKAARASQFKGERKVHAGVGKTWHMDENGNPIPTDKPKKKAAVLEVGPSRREAARERKEGERKVAEKDFSNIKITKQMFDDFSEGQKKLNENQLKRVLEAVSGVALQSDEVNHVLALADRNGDGMIDMTEIPEVQEIIAQYLKTRRTISEIFKQYDINHDNVLDHGEMKLLLTSLNDGIPVAEDEVAWVMTSTAQFKDGKIHRGEVERAINFWYNYTEDPPDNILLPKDRRKGGIVGRALTGMHHHDKKHIEERHAGKGKGNKTSEVYVSTRPVLSDAGA